jgi:hypothetical protein
MYIYTDNTIYREGTEYEVNVLKCCYEYNISLIEYYYLIK